MHFHFTTILLVVILWKGCVCDSALYCLVLLRFSGHGSWGLFIYYLLFNIITGGCSLQDDFIIVCSVLRNNVGAKHTNSHGLVNNIITPAMNISKLILYYTSCSPTRLILNFIPTLYTLRGEVDWKKVCYILP